MAEEEVIGAASPAPSDHKRKHEDVDSEPFEQPPVAAKSNGNSELVADGDAAPAGVSPEDHDVKRPRLDDKPDKFEATENGHQEEKTEDVKEDVTEPPVADKNTESGEGPEKTDEPLDAANKESLADETHKGSVELQSAGIPEESAKGEQEESIEGHQDPTPDVIQKGDAFGVEEQASSADKLTSRKMEIPSNKVGVLIGKAGDTIRTLQYSSGARIQITRDVDADPSSVTRPVELIGSIENINKAERLIKDVIAEADAGGSPSLVAKGFTVQSSGAGEQIQIQVPNEKVGFIIGKGGETIKNLQTRSGARIQLIPQHLPEGDQSKERTVRVTGDRRQIETAKEMIKEVMNQPTRSSAPSSGNNQQANRSRGPGQQWGPRGHHPSQPTGYNNYQQRGSYPPQSPQYSSQAYGNYPPQQPPPRNNFGWDQRPPTNMQGPPDRTGYDYYGGHGGHRAAPSPQPPMHSHGPGPVMGPPPSQVNYNYGQPQGPSYGQQQQPSPYPQTTSQGYGHGYGDNQGPAPQPYGGHNTQPTPYPQAITHPGYGQQDQYGKPPAYNMPQQGPYAPPYGQARQQPYPSGPSPQAYPQYGTAPAATDGYGQAAPAPGSYPQQSGPPVSGYAPPTGAQQQVPVYAPQTGPAVGYGQYPATQPGYTEQAAPSNAGYGYQGAADPAYAGGGATMAYGTPPSIQPAYSQPAPAPVPVAAQPGYDQSIPQAGGYVTPQPQPQMQPGYVQYDNSQMYAGHR